MIYIVTVELLVLRLKSMLREMDFRAKFAFWFQIRNNTHTAKEMALSIERKEEKHKLLIRGNKELEMDIEDIHDKIQQWLVFNTFPLKWRAIIRPPPERSECCGL